MCACGVALIHSDDAIVFEALGDSLERYRQQLVARQAAERRRVRGTHLPWNRRRCVQPAFAAALGLDVCLFTSLLTLHLILSTEPTAPVLFRAIGARARGVHTSVRLCNRLNFCLHTLTT